MSHEEIEKQKPPPGRGLSCPGSPYGGACRHAPAGSGFRRSRSVSRVHSLRPGGAKGASEHPPGRRHPPGGNSGVRHRPRGGASDGAAGEKRRHRGSGRPHRPGGSGHGDAGHRRYSEGNDLPAKSAGKRAHRLGFRDPHRPGGAGEGGLRPGGGQRGGRHAPIRVPCGNQSGQPHGCGRGGGL